MLKTFINTQVAVPLKAMDDGIRPNASVLELGFYLMVYGNCI